MYKRGEAGTITIPGADTTNVVTVVVPGVTTVNGGANAGGNGAGGGAAAGADANGGAAGEGDNGDNGDNVEVTTPDNLVDLDENQARQRILTWTAMARRHSRLRRQWSSAWALWRRCWYLQYGFGSG